MAALAELYVRATVTDTSGLSVNREAPATRFAPVGSVGQRQTISLPGSTFTALTVPTGSRAVMLILGQATSLVLKGITGDTGVNLTPSANPLGFDAVLPLGATPSLGLLNNNVAAQSIDVLFL